MNLGEIFRIGFRGLQTHKLRSLLTTLGVIFGVGAVIAMLSVGAGARYEVMQQIKSMGINNIFIKDRSPKPGEEGFEEARFSKGLSLSDAEYIGQVCPHIEQIVAIREEGTRSVRFGSNETEADIFATTPEYFQVLDLNIDKGRSLRERDLDRYSRICVIGEGVKKSLFPHSDPIGEKIKIDDQWFMVVGLTGTKQTISKEAADITNPNRSIYIPLATALKRISIQKKWVKNQIDQILVRVTSSEKTTQVAHVIETILDHRHKSVDDYDVIVPIALLEQSRRTQRIFNIVMGSIAGLSLLVGGIGIMNIMLATVLERTREIGIRRAVGARERDILAQFLVQALIMSISGGMIGVILGATIGKLISLFAGWKTIVTFTSVLFSFGIAASVGIIFGMYPARRAARLDPIEALRHE